MTANRSPLDDLPPYLNCDDCGLRHFLTINRDVQGKWSAAYLAYGDEGQSTLPHLWLNNAETLDEVALRMQLKLRRFNPEKAS